MSAINLISRYNHFSGLLNVATLKEYHAELQKYLDSEGSGPHVPVLKGIYDRVTKTIKAANGYKKIKVQVTPVTIPVVKKKAPKRVAKQKSVTSKPVAGVTLPVKNEVLKPEEKKIAAPVANNSALSSLGFLSASKAPEKAAGTFSLPNQMGALFGTQQRYKLVYVIAGETASSKSQLGMQIANAFAEMGDDVAWLDYEQGGLHSRDTQLSVSRNTSPMGKSRIHVKGDYPKTLESLKQLAKTAKVIAIDSGTAMRLRSNTWIDELREECPNTVWIIMMQLLGDGTTRGGTGAEFDAPTVVKTFRPDKSDPLKNYAIVEKNRGNKTGIKYLINQKKFAK